MCTSKRPTLNPKPNPRIQPNQKLILFNRGETTNQGEGDVTWWC